MRSIKKSRVKRNKVKKRTYRKSRDKGKLSRRSTANKKVKRKRKMSKKKNKMKGGSGNNLSVGDLNHMDRGKLETLFNEKEKLLSKIERIQGVLTSVTYNFTGAMNALQEGAPGNDGPIEDARISFHESIRSLESVRDLLDSQLYGINNKINKIIN